MVEVVKDGQGDQAGGQDRHDDIFGCAGRKGPPGSVRSPCSDTSVLPGLAEGPGSSTGRTRGSDRDDGGHIGGCPCQESRRGEALIGPPKTLAGRRTLALPTEVVPELEAHLTRWVSVEPTASVFVGEQGGPLRAGVWHKEWDRARRSVGLPHLHLDDLRHVAGTLAAATGAGTKEIMRRLGHATQEAALHYQHATDERDRVLASGIDRLIREAREAPSAPVVPLRSVDGAGRLQDRDGRAAGS